MSTLSIDLASRRYEDIGVVILCKATGRIRITPIRLTAPEFVDRPNVETLVDKILEVAAKYAATTILLDGPQAWKANDNQNVYARSCERELRAPGKTGLPGVTLPHTYLGFISFSIQVFEALASRTWKRLATKDPQQATHCTVETFPTAAWRSIGMRPLPGRRRTTPSDIVTWTTKLQEGWNLDLQHQEITHDELQATVAGLAGIALEEGNVGGLHFAGRSPFYDNGTCREGFIVSPRTCA
jgi:hypothetical protein